MRSFCVCYVTDLRVLFCVCYLRALFCVCYVNILRALVCNWYINDLRALFCIFYINDLLRTLLCYVDGVRAVLCLLPWQIRVGDKKSASEQKVGSISVGSRSSPGRESWKREWSVVSVT